jgi:hypothetical protein
MPVTTSHLPGGKSWDRTGSDETAPEGAPAVIAVEEVLLMTDATSVSRGLGRRRWLILGVIGLAQLMVVLDSTG